METTRITVPELGRMKAAGERITMVTAYDWTFARLLDAAGVELLLVGDSLGNVVQGHDTTLPGHPRRDGLPHPAGDARRAGARWWSATCRSARTSRAPSAPSRARSAW